MHLLKAIVLHQIVCINLIDSEKKQRWGYLFSLNYNNKIVPFLEKMNIWKYAWSLQLRDEDLNKKDAARIYGLTQL